MTAPISRIGGQQRVTRDNGSDGHEQVARQLDTDPKAQAAAHPQNQKVQDVAKMYERQFLGEMFKAMRSTVSETDKPSMAQNIYNSQRDDQYIDAWSEQGGVGFSKVIYDQIMERFFGQTQGGQDLKKQGMIPLTNRDIAKVSEVKGGVATPVVPRANEVAVNAPPVNASDAKSNANSNSAPEEMSVAQASANLLKAMGASRMSEAQMQTPAPELKTSALPLEALTVENTEPMAAPTPPKADTRSLEERVAAKELFPTSATERESSARPVIESQTALQIEVRPSPTGAPARIQAPWDATVVQATKLDGSRTAVTLEHGKGLRSTLVFDGVLSAQASPGQKIPRGEAIGTLNQDAKSFLWNLSPQAQTSAQSQSAVQ